MRLLLPAIVLSLCAIFTAASPVPEPVDPGTAPPAELIPKIYIKDVKYSGSGCPPDTVKVSGNADWTIVTLMFQKYVASIGPRDPPGQESKKCDIDFKIFFPQGVSFANFKTDYVGRVELEAKVEAIRKTKYWFGPPQFGKKPQPCHWFGPISEDYQCTDTIPERDLVWSPCGGSTTLNADTEIALNNTLDPKASGMLTTDTIDHKVTTELKLRWKKCP